MSGRSREFRKNVRRMLLWHIASLRQVRCKRRPVIESLLCHLIIAMALFISNGKLRSWHVVCSISYTNFLILRRLVVGREREITFSNRVSRLSLIGEASNQWIQRLSFMCVRRKLASGRARLVYNSVFSYNRITLSKLLSWLNKFLFSKVDALSYNGLDVQRWKDLTEFESHFHISFSIFH